MKSRLLTLMLDTWTPAYADISSLGYPRGGAPVAGAPAWDWRGNRRGSPAPGARAGAGLQPARESAQDFP